MDLKKNEHHLALLLLIIGGILWGVNAFMPSVYGMLSAMGFGWQVIEGLVGISALYVIWEMMGKK